MYEEEAPETLDTLDKIEKTSNGKRKEAEKVTAWRSRRRQPPRSKASMASRNLEKQKAAASARKVASAAGRAATGMLKSHLTKQRGKIKIRWSTDV